MTTWTTATRCAGNGACIEIAHHDARVLLRNSTDPDGPRLALTPGAWQDLLRAVKEIR